MTPDERSRVMVKERSEGRTATIRRPISLRIRGTKGEPEQLEVASAVTAGEMSLTLRAPSGGQLRPGGELPTGTRLTLSGSEVLTSELASEADDEIAVSLSEVAPSLSAGELVSVGRPEQSGMPAYWGPAGHRLAAAVPASALTSAAGAVYVARADLSWRPDRDDELVGDEVHSIEHSTWAPTVVMLYA